MAGGFAPVTDPAVNLITRHAGINVEIVRIIRRAIVYSRLRIFGTQLPAHGSGLAPS